MLVTVSIPTAVRGLVLIAPAGVLEGGVDVELDYNIHEIERPAWLMPVTVGEDRAYAFTGFACPDVDENVFHDPRMMIDMLRTLGGTE